MFFSRGKIDIEKMSSTSCIVDGQQRTNAIIEFIENKFSVGGRFFKDLNNEEKGAFLKYEIAVVELDLDNDSPDVLEIFKRLNRTANSLTAIEKLASEYAPTEYMYVARLLANDADPIEIQADLDEEDWRIDPNLPIDLIDWALTKTPSPFAKLTSKLKVFSERELARKVHLMYVLNIMSTVTGGFFNRNEKTTNLLEDYKDAFPAKDKIYDLIHSALMVVDELNLENINFWSAKANFFSLIVGIVKRLEAGDDLNLAETRTALIEFAAEPNPNYVLAAREAVNNKQERLLRNQHIMILIKS